MASSKTVIFQDVCRRICDASGFQYKKSRASGIRAGGVFEERLTFSSSASINRLPDAIHLEVGAHVWSDAIGDFRKRNDSPERREGLRGYLAGASTIENLLRPGPPYVRYDVGDESTRDAVIDRVVGVVRGEVQGFFDLFHSLETLLAAIEGEEWAALSRHVNLVDVFLFSEDLPLARRYARWLRDAPTDAYLQRLSLT